MHVARLPELLLSLTDTRYSVRTESAHRWSGFRAMALITTCCVAVILAVSAWSPGMLPSDAQYFLQ